MADYLHEYVLFWGASVSIKTNPTGRRCNRSKDKGGRGQQGRMENDEGGQGEVTPPDQLTETCSSILTPSSCNCLQKPLTDFNVPLLLQFSDKIPHFKRPFALLRGLGVGVLFFFFLKWDFLVGIQHFALLIPQVFLFRSQVAKHHAVPFPFTVILPPRSAIMRQSAHHAELHRIFASTKEWSARSTPPTLQSLHLHYSSSPCKHSIGPYVSSKFPSGLL